MLAGATCNLALVYATYFLLDINISGGPIQRSLSNVHVSKSIETANMHTMCWQDVAREMVMQ